MKKIYHLRAFGFHLLQEVSIPSGWLKYGEKLSYMTGRSLNCIRIYAIVFELYFNMFVSVFLPRSRCPLGVLTKKDILRHVRHHNPNNR